MSGPLRTITNLFFPQQGGQDDEIPQIIPIVDKELTVGPRSGSSMLKRFAKYGTSPCPWADWMACIPMDADDVKSILAQGRKFMKEHDQTVTPESKVEQEGGEVDSKEIVPLGEGKMETIRPGNNTKYDPEQEEQTIKNIDEKDETLDRASNHLGSLSASFQPSPIVDNPVVATGLVSELLRQEQQIQGMMRTATMDAKLLMEEKKEMRTDPEFPIDEVKEIEQMIDLKIRDIVVLFKSLFHRRTKLANVPLEWEVFDEKFTQTGGNEEEIKKQEDLIRRAQQAVQQLNLEIKNNKNKNQVNQYKEQRKRIRQYIPRLQNKLRNLQAKKDLTEQEAIEHAKNIGVPEKNISQGRKRTALFNSKKVQLPNKPPRSIPTDPNVDDLGGNTNVSTNENLTLQKTPEPVKRESQSFTQEEPTGPMIEMTGRRINEDKSNTNEETIPIEENNNTVSKSNISNNVSQESKSNTSNKEPSTKKKLSNRFKEGYSRVKQAVSKGVAKVKETKEDIAKKKALTKKRLAIIQNFEDYYDQLDQLYGFLMEYKKTKERFLGRVASASAFMIRMLLVSNEDDIKQVESKIGATANSASHSLMTILEREAPTQPSHLPFGMRDTIKGQTGGSDYEKANLKKLAEMFMVEYKKELQKK